MFAEAILGDILKAALKSDAYFDH